MSKYLDIDNKLINTKALNELVPDGFTARVRSRNDGFLVIVHGGTRWCVTYLNWFDLGQLKMNLDNLLKMVIHQHVKDLSNENN